MTTQTKLSFLLTLALLAIPLSQALALITGGTGNNPLRDPGWPEGAAEIFNTQTRIAYWEGPPFGGGQWHAECRGDAKALSVILAEFAKLDVKSKQVVLHDGIGRSFWLAPNREPEKLAAAQMDWMFMVWQKANWERLRKLPADLNPTNGNADDGPPAQIDVYTGSNVKWDEVVVPKGLKIVDRRLVAHGFTTADGVVLEGKVMNVATGQPLAAKIRLERVEPQAKGGYAHPIVAVATADAQGHWVMKKTPDGWHRVVVEAEGFVPRVAGYGKFDGQPCWQGYDCDLVAAAAVSGRVVDEQGKPLAAVSVSFHDVATAAGRDEAPDEYTVKTGDDGRFRADQLPTGKATIWITKSGYTRPGLGLAISMPSQDVELRMIKSAKVIVTVDFTGKERPEGYLVHVEPEGGSRIGSWGGTGNIDVTNQITFENVPPGTYVFYGRPNPGSDRQQTESVTVEVKGGETTKITLNAK